MPSFLICCSNFFLIHINFYWQEIREETTIEWWANSICHNGILCIQFRSVQSLSHVRLFATPMDCSTPGLPAHHQLSEFTQTHVHWVRDVIQPSRPLSPALLLFSIFPSIRVFSNELALCIRRPKYWSFSFSSSPSKEYSGLISFRMDWWDLLAVQGTLKSLLQHYSSKASILWHSAFFIV